MNCPKCGAANDDRASLCSACGAALDQPGPARVRDPRLQTLIELLPAVRWPLVCIGAGIVLVICGFIFPAVGGVFVYLVLFLDLLFSSGGNRFQRQSSNVDVNDPASSFWGGGIFLVIGIGWLALVLANRFSRADSADRQA